MQLHPHDQIARTAISPDGRWVATATYWGRQSTIKVWDAVTGELVRDLPGEGLNGDARVAFSPDGRWLVLVTPHAYRFYEVGSWQPGRTHPRDRADISSAPVAFAPDGKILAILQNLRLVQLIDVATGQELASLAPPDPRGIGHLAFSPDGSWLSGACGDGVIQMWDLRHIRQQLASMGLDWDAPPYPPPKDTAPANPIEVKVELGDAALLMADDPTQVGLNSFLLALNPFNFEAYWQRGKAYGRLQQARKAIADYSMALTLMPANDRRRSEVLLRRANNYYLLNDHVRAFADLQQLLKLGLPEADELRESVALLCNNLAWLYVTGPEKLRDPDKALTLAQKAVGLTPGQWIHLNTLGVVYYRLGKYPQSVETLERSLRESKGEAAAFNLFFLAMCHAKRGDAAKAKDCYDRAEKWVQDNQGKLQPTESRELSALQAEAESVLDEHAVRSFGR